MSTVALQLSCSKANRVSQSIVYTAAFWSAMQSLYHLAYLHPVARLLQHAWLRELDQYHEGFTFHCFTMFQVRSYGCFLLPILFLLDTM